LLNIEHCRAAVLITLACLIGACGQKDKLGDATDVSAPLLTAKSLGPQTLRTNSEYLASADYTGADTAWGERLSMQCRACHGFDAGTGSMIGPSLYGMFGRKAGSSHGFDYSPSLAEAGLVWTPRALDAWLVQPAQFLPGNRMAFAGMSKEDDRRALIAFLLMATDDTSPD